MNSDDDEIAKLRRFTLLAGLALFVYAISGAELDLEGDFRPLGIPLKLKRANLIGYGLLIVSVYAALRYCLLALILADSPIKARARLRRGYQAIWRPGQIRPGPFLNSFAEDLSKYYPPYGRWAATMPSDIVEHEAGRPRLEGVIIPLPIRIIGQIHNFDYWLPVLANIAALITNVLHHYGVV